MDYQVILHTDNLILVDIGRNTAFAIRRADGGTLLLMWVDTGKIKRHHERFVNLRSIEYLNRIINYMIKIK